MLDADSVPRQAYERLLAEYKALVDRVGLPCMSADHFRHAQAVLAMGRRELEDAASRRRPGGTQRG